MKRWFIPLTLVLILPLVAQAAGDRSVLLATGKQVADNYVQAGSTITVDGDVTGDVILAGSDIIVRGHVGGDALIAGNRVQILGAVDGNVRVVGNDIQLAGLVGKNVTVAGSTITLTKDSVVNGTISLAGATVHLDGTAKHQVDAWAGEVIVSGAVGGDLRVRTEQGQPAIRLTDTATVGGVFRYTAENKAEIASGAKISGATEYTAKTVKHRAPFVRHFQVFQSVMKFFGMILVGLVLLGIARRFTEEVTGTMATRPGWSVLRGVFVLIGVPLLALFFVLTIIGIPLALLVTAAYGMAFLITSPLAAYRIGQWVGPWLGKHGVPMAQKLSPTWTLILGALVMFLVVDVVLAGAWMENVPLLGLLGSLLRSYLVIWSLGALDQTIWNRVRRGSTATH